MLMRYKGWMCLIIVGLLGLMALSASAEDGDPKALTISAQITWVDQSTNEDGFRVEANTDGGAFTQVGQVAANVTTFTHTGLVAGKDYCWRVLAFSAVGASAPGPQACASTKPPAAPGTTTVQLTVTGTP